MHLELCGTEGMSAVVSELSLAENIILRDGLNLLVINWRKKVLYCAHKLLTKLKNIPITVSGNNIKKMSPSQI